MGSVDRLNPQFLLRNAHRHMRRMNKYRGLPLWSLMSDLTSHGSTISMDLCRQMGWDPHANVNSDLPHANYVRERPSQETPAEDICPTTGLLHQLPAGHVCLYCHIGNLAPNRGPDEPI